METQTSLAPEFSSSPCESGEESFEGKERGHAQKKISVQFSGVSEIPKTGQKLDTSDGGEGWREFCPWSHGEGKEKVMEDVSASNTTPYSREDLRGQMKGFINWAEQIELLKQAAGTETMECGGEELSMGRGGNRHTSCLQDKANKQSGFGQKKGMLFKQTGGYQYQRAKPFRLPPIRQDKKTQRVLCINTPGGKSSAEETSLFYSQNISFEQKMQPKSETSNRETLPPQPVMNMLSEKIAKLLTPSEKDIAFKQEKRANKPKVITAKLRSSYDYDQNKERTAGSLAKPGNSGSVAAASVQLSDAKEEDCIGVPRIADKPIMLNRPSKDIVFWTL